MQKQTILYIPQPCHEDWNTMTPTQHGKFCSACSKQVIDFSLMSDQQVLTYLSGQAGKTCGRFEVSQLERPLAETTISRKKSWWMAVTIALLLLFNRSKAQDSKIVGDTVYAVFPKNDITKALVGKVAICKPAQTISLIDTAITEPDEIIINAKVVDENNIPLSYASVAETGKPNGTVTDSAGNFSLTVAPHNETAGLTASLVGYTKTEKQISLTGADTEAIIKLEPALTGEVVVMGYAIPKPKDDVSTCPKISWVEKTDAAIRKSLRASGFQIYPNPVLQKGTLQLEIKQAGEYQVQLLDNQSRLIQTERIRAASANSTTSFPVTPGIAPGIYYLRLIDEHKKKSYTEKLIIQ